MAESKEQTMQTTLDHLTDEALQAKLNSPYRGWRAEAEVLLQVPAEDRLDLVRKAQRMRNMTGSVWSYCLESELREYRQAHPVAVAVQVPAMKAGEHEQMLAGGWRVLEQDETSIVYVAGEFVDEFGCNSECWVRVETGTRNVLDFG